jgi:predicted RNA-binding Zn-ribbon protein involved in translation (DUF1610 family)
LSFDAETIRRPSGLYATDQTSLLWPERARISLPVSASHTLTVLSSDAETIRCPSGLYAAEKTLLVCPNCGNTAASWAATCTAASAVRQRSAYFAKPVFMGILL